MSLRIFHTIAFRLFLFIGSAQLLVLFALSFSILRIQEEYVMDYVVMTAARVSDIIIRSTRSSMMANRKDQVHEIITSLRGEPGLDGVRIYNKSGEIVFATDTTDLRHIVDMKAEACNSCHDDGVGVTAAHEGNMPLHRIFEKPNGERLLGLITPILNEPQCATELCHAHPPEKTILGVLDARMKLGTIDEGLADSRNRFAALSIIAALLVSGFSGLFIRSMIHSPVRSLMDGMSRVSSGRLDHRLLETSRGEISDLARSFNTMTEELARARHELTTWSKTLEQRVKEKTADLEMAYAHMLHVERLASLGNLAATVAHELNNPLEGILTFARLVRKQIERSPLPEDEKCKMVAQLNLVADEALRSGDIVKNLLLFARPQHGEFRKVTIRHVINRCVMLVRHHADMSNVKIDIRCPDDIVGDCDEGKIQQAVVALMMNAIEAMGPAGSQGGTLTIEACLRDNLIHLVIADTGIGMSEEIRSHIFEPFYTTKSEGKGVGLGLSIVHGIVQLHHGSVTAESIPGQGSRFTIALPQDQTVPTNPAGTGVMTKEVL